MSGPRSQGTSKRFVTGGLSTRTRTCVPCKTSDFLLVLAVQVVPSEAIVLPRMRADETCLCPSSTKHQCKRAYALPMTSSNWTKLVHGLSLHAIHYDAVGSQWEACIVRIGVRFGKLTNVEV